MSQTDNSYAVHREEGSKVYLILVCLVAALGGLLFGYDTGVINGAIGPLTEHFALDANWQGWAMGCALLGCAIGAGFAGALSDRLGRKKVLIISAILFFVSAVGTALPKSVTAFIIYRMLGGLGVGAASMSSPMYIAEITPARIRGRMVSVNQFAIVTGFLVVYFVNYFIALQGDTAWNQQFGWRWMFGSESLPAVLLLVLLFFVPESPRWLTKQGRSGEAQAILSRVDGSEFAKTELAEIEETIAHESGSLKQLLQPGMKIVLVIGIVLAVLQQVTGINVFLYFGTEIFKKMGSETNAALLQTVVVGTVNLTFTIIAIWTVDKLGRKPLMAIGSTGMGISLLAMGLAAYYQRTELWLLLFIIGYIACFALSVGPVTWVILSEIFPTRIRGRAMAIATVCLWIANYVVSQTFPMMDEDPWLLDKFHHGFPFWVYGVFCAVLLVFVWMFVPETKGKTLEEIEKHWMRQN
ncbi:MAG: sugar porter family MFS transporter [Phycisphaerales bacterium]|nr:MAG: sugar porter family MFS transporter [Phycisphaerales bacterium]